MGSSAETSVKNEGPNRALFGFDLDEGRWLERLREYDSDAGNSAARDAGIGRIGEYEIVGAVGRGGQGVVFRARQPRTGRDIALKRLSAGAFATPEMRGRFAREVAAAAALDHPNIVTVYGSELIDEQPVLAMQWVDGAPFDHWAAAQRALVHEGRASSGAARAGGRTKAGAGPAGANHSAGIRSILEAFSLVCDAIQHAHQRGIIHRDIKPSNVLVDARGRPHVLDFGLAKLVNAEHGDATITQTGMFVGTPAYAAPEVAAGRHEDVDVRTDVYALGVLLYQALTGQTPFDATQELQRLLWEIQHRDPRPMSAIDGRLNRELDAIALKALMKEKASRYGSVDALSADVRRYLAGQAVLAHPPSTTYRARKFIRQHRWGVTIAAAFVALLVGATATSTMLYFRAEDRRGEAEAARIAESEQLKFSEAQRKRAESNQTKASAAVKLLDEMLAQAHRGARGGVPTVTLREVVDNVAAELDGGSKKDEPEVEAWMRMSIGNAYLGLGLLAPSESNFSRAIEIRRSVLGEEHLDVAESMEKLGRAYRAAGDLIGAERMLEGALAIRRRLIADPDDPYFAVNLSSLGILKRHQRKFAEAEADFAEALRIYKKSLGPENESVPLVMQNLSLVYLDSGRPELAAPLIQEATELARKLHGERHYDVATCETNMCSVMLALGRIEAAEQAGRMAVATLTALLGDRHPRLAMAQERLADALLASRNETKGAEASSEERATGDSAVEVVDANDGDGSDRFEEALYLLSCAIESFRAARLTGDQIRCQARMGTALRGAGRLDEAEGVAREALHAATGTGATVVEEIARLEQELAEILVEQGSIVEARGLIVSALERVRLLEENGGGGSEGTEVLECAIRGNLERIGTEEERKLE